MSTHSGILARKIPRREEPDELQSVGLQRVRPGRHSGNSVLLVTPKITLHINVHNCGYIIVDEILTCSGLSNKLLQCAMCCSPQLFCKLALLKSFLSKLHRLIQIITEHCQSCMDFAFMLFRTLLL